jgi:hypothetical protein
MRNRRAMFAASLSGLLGVTAAACSGGSNQPSSNGSPDSAGPSGPTAGDAGAFDATAAGPDGALSGEPDAAPEADTGASDAGTSDAGPSDAGPSDAGPSDAGPSDAGPSDAGPSDAGSAPDSVNGSACVYTAGASVECCGGFTIQSTGADGGVVTDNVSLYQYECALFTVLPTSIDFGNVTVGTASQITVNPGSIYCPGEAEVDFGLTAAAGAPLFQTTRGCAPLGPVCTTQWLVTFFPQAAGPQSTTLYITAESSHSCENLSIPMTGTGVLP